MHGFQVPKHRMDEVMTKLGERGIRYVWWNCEKFIYNADFKGPAEIEVDAKDWPAYEEILREVGIIKSVDLTHSERDLLLSALFVKLPKNENERQRIAALMSKLEFKKV